MRGVSLFLTLHMPHHDIHPHQTAHPPACVKRKWGGGAKCCCCCFFLFFCCAFTAWNPPSSSISSPRNLLSPSLFSPTALSRRVHQCREVSRACVARTGPPGPWTGETKVVKKLEIITKTWGNYNTFWYKIGVKQHIGLIAWFRWFFITENQLHD